MASIQPEAMPSPAPVLLLPSAQLLSIAHGVQQLLCLVLTALLVLAIHRLVLRPYRMYHTLSQHLPSLPFFPVLGQAPLLLWGFVTNRCSGFGIEHLRSHSHTFIFLFMHHPTILTMHPTVISQVIKSSYACYDKGPISRATMAPITGSSNLLVAEEPQHTLHRQRITPAFAHHNLHSMTQLMMDLTAQHIAGLQQRIAAFSYSSPLLLLDLKPEFTALTFSIITSCAFGTSLSSLPQAPHILHRTFHTLLHAISFRNLTFIPHIPVLCSLPMLHLPAIQRGRREVDALVSAIIAQRRSGLSSPLCAGHDLLSLLLKENAADGETSAEREQAVRDQTLAFIFAGHETTAGLMSWMFAQLVRRPELVQQLRHELQTVTEGEALQPHHLPQLALLDAVISETLRLYPPAPLMFRRCITEHTLAVPAAYAFDSKAAASDSRAIPVPPGAFVLCDIYAMHRVPEFWGDDAAEFKPSRWLQSGRAYSHPAAFLPFSAGQRSCVGQQFALLEARIMAAQFIAAFDLLLPAEHRLQELFGEIKISYAPRNVWANIQRH